MKYSIEDLDVLSYIDAKPSEFYSIIYGIFDMAFEIFPDWSISLVGKRITMAVEEKWRKWVLGITASSRNVALDFRLGGSIEDPGKILPVTEKKNRVIRFTDLKQLKKISKKLKPLIEQALKL
jgi:hypothetical protein